VDVTLSSDDDIVHLPEPDVSADQKVSSGDDIGDNGATSAKPTAPGPISSVGPKQFKSSTADWVLSILPPCGSRGRKRPPPATKRSNPILQLIK
jgi:hypothetical protein